jgi:hypothetical protein
MLRRKRMSRAEAAQRRQEVADRGELTYLGRRCTADPSHNTADGEAARYVAGGKCVACIGQRNAAPDHVDRLRAYSATEERRDYLRAWRGRAAAQRGGRSGGESEG